MIPKYKPREAKPGFSRVSVLQLQDRIVKAIEQADLSGTATAEVATSDTQAVIGMALLGFVEAGYDIEVIHREGVIGNNLIRLPGVVIVVKLSPIL